MDATKTVSISRGNSKMGGIPSVSLPPVTTCPAGAPCAKLCYAAKLCKFRPSMAAAYARNLEIYKTDFVGYFLQIEAVIKTSRFFRFHVAGDIPEDIYLCEMAAVARRNPHCKILCFTKRYGLVNTWLDQHTKPENLQLIFSEWGDTPVPNPHNLPTAAVIFKGREPAQNWKICGGNCTECASCGIGCWELKPGETIAFYQH